VYHALIARARAYELLHFPSRVLTRGDRIENNNRDARSRSREARRSQRAAASAITSAFVIVNRLNSHPVAESAPRSAVPPAQFRRDVFGEAFSTMVPWEPITLPPSCENGRPFRRCSLLRESPANARAYARTFRLGSSCVHACTRVTTTATRSVYVFTHERTPVRPRIPENTRAYVCVRLLGDRD